MTCCKKLVRCLAAPLAAIFFLTSSGLGTAHAGLVTTEDAVERAGIDADRAHLLGLIEREDIRQELIGHGVDPDEAARRIAALSDAELSGVMQKVDEMPAGQSALGIIVGAALIVFIVLLITDIAGFTDVFGFVNK
jgi:hypothetical protein